MNTDQSTCGPSTDREQPTLVAEGQPVHVVTPADGACLIEMVAAEPLDSAAKMRIVSWLTGLQPAALYADADPQAQA